MNTKSINLIFFSPTGTSKKISQKIANNIGLAINQEYNLTKKLDKVYSVSNDSLNIIAVPVYGGRVPLIAIERLNKIKANNALAVIVVLYGNRAFDDALLELNNISTNNGFKVISAAAFIGEHSYNTTEYKIAEGRPDTKDLSIAEQYGKQIYEKLNSTKIASLNNIPGNLNYRERKVTPLISPEVNNALCSKCGNCIEQCPVDAISFVNNIIAVDKEKCMMCCACVKQCKDNALSFDEPWINNLRNLLIDNFPERKEAEIFI